MSSDPFPSATTALMSSEVLDDDGWAAVAGIWAGVASDRIAKVLSGAAATTTLPAELAELVVGRLAGRDLAAAVAVAGADQRVGVSGTLTAAKAAAVRSAHSVDVAALTAELAALTVDRPDRLDITYAPLRRHLAAAKIPSDALAEAVFAGIASGTFAGTGTGDDEQFAGAVAKVLVMLSRRGQEAFAALAADANAPLRARLAAAAIVTTNRSVIDVFAFSLDDVLAAAAVVATFTRFKDAQFDQLRTNVAKWAAREGSELVGPGSVAEVLGFDDLAAPPHAALRTLIAAAGDSPDPSLLDDVLCAATADGTVALDGFPTPLGRTSPHLPARVALAAAGRVGTLPAAAREFFQVMVGAHGHRWTRTEIEDAFATHPARAEALLSAAPGWSEAPGGASAVLPDWFVERSQRHVGLGAWVARDPRVADQLATAAEGIGPDRWSVLVALLGEFRGTVDELVAVTAEVARSSAA